LQTTVDRPNLLLVQVLQQHIGFLHPDRPVLPEPAMHPRIGKCGDRGAVTTAYQPPIAEVRDKVADMHSQFVGDFRGAAALNAAAGSAPRNRLQEGGWAEALWKLEPQVVRAVDALEVEGRPGGGGADEEALDARPQVGHHVLVLRQGRRDEQRVLQRVSRGGRRCLNYARQFGTNLESKFEGQVGHGDPPFSSDRPSVPVKRLNATRYRCWEGIVTAAT